MRQRSFDANPIPVEGLGDAKLVRLLRYWDSRRYGRICPLRKDLRPEDMKDLLGRIALFDVERDRDSAAFSFRLVGTALTRILECDLTGQSLAAMQPRQYRRLLHDLLMAAYEKEAPVCQEVTLGQQRQSFTYKALALPVSVTPDEVDIVLMACNWETDQVPLVDPLGQRFA